jgi:hypothetical protein
VHAGDPVAGLLAVVAEVLELAALVVVIVLVGTVVLALVDDWPAVVGVLWLLDPPQALSSSATAAARIGVTGRMGLCSRGAVADPAHFRDRPIRLPPSRAMSAHTPNQEIARAEAVAESLAKRDPFWAPQLLVAGAIVLDLSLPEKLTLGPTWLLPAVEGLLLLALMMASPHPNIRHSPLRRAFALGIIGLVSAVNIVSLILLCHFLLHHGTKAVSGPDLVRSGVVLWVTNVLLFGLWYWQLDRGGPLARAMSADAHPDFLFSQMSEPGYSRPGWMPGLIDYLYVSFTNATAFSPTDTMPLSATAKLLMGAQALAALITVGLVVARAVNILR